MPPTPQQMFGASSSADAAAKFEDYKGELRKSFARADQGTDMFVKGVGIVKDARVPSGVREERLRTLETLEKSLTPDQLANMSAALGDMREALAKDWNASFPENGTMTLPTQLAPIDLEAPSKKLVPRETPLSNSIVRDNSGRGSAVQFRRILGWSNAGVGGVPDLSSFMSSEFPSSQSTANLPQFGGYSNTTGGVASGGLGLRRGQKITYAADSKNVAFMEQGLSDEVSWKAQYIGEGFEDIRQLSATVLMWSHKMAEERNLLYGRGTTNNGYTGAVAQPGNPVVTTSSTGGAVAAGTYYVVITAAASGGESVTNAAQQATAALTGSTNTITVAFPALPAGATGWNVYIGTATGGPYYFQAFVPSGWISWTFTATPAATGTALPSIAGTIDTTANPNGYDGFLTVLLGSASGYVSNLVMGASAAASYNSIGGNTVYPGTTTKLTAQGDAPFQNAFEALYGASTMPGNYGASAGGAAAWPWTSGTAFGQKLLADPDVVYCDGNIRKAMGDFYRQNGSGASAYRIMVTEGDATNGLNVGAIVNGIANQTTGKMVDFDAHPYMPLGAAVIWSKTLPVPDSEVSSTFAVKAVQPIMMQPWPVIQYTYDASTYQLDALVPYAPAWSGAITGLLA